MSLMWNDADDASTLAGTIDNDARSETWTIVTMTGGETQLEPELPIPESRQEPHSENSEQNTAPLPRDPGSARATSDPPSGGPSRPGVFLIPTAPPLPKRLPGLPRMDIVPPRRPNPPPPFKLQQDDTNRLPTLPETLIAPTADRAYSLAVGALTSNLPPRPPPCEISSPSATGLSRIFSRLTSLVPPAPNTTPHWKTILQRCNDLDFTILELLNDNRFSSVEQLNYIPPPATDHISTPLTSAIASTSGRLSKIAFVNLLLRLGANPDICPADGPTPLSLSVSLSLKELFPILIHDGGANPHLAISTLPLPQGLYPGFAKTGVATNLSALDISVIMNDVSCFLALAEGYYSPNSFVMVPWEFNRFSVYHENWTQNWLPGLTIYPPRRLRHKVTAVHMARAAVLVKMEQRHLLPGFALTARDSRGQTPVHWAADRGDVDALRIMLSRAKALGLSISDLKDEDGATPLAMACEAVERGQLHHDTIVKTPAWEDRSSGWERSIYSPHSGYRGYVSARWKWTGMGTGPVRFERNDASKQEIQGQEERLAGWRADYVGTVRLLLKEGADAWYVWPHERSIMERFAAVKECWSVFWPVFEEKLLYEDQNMGLGWGCGMGDFWTGGGGHGERCCKGHSHGAGVDGFDGTRFE